ncbi:MAG: hypothetical protein V1746_06210 [bacterium]
MAKKRRSSRRASSKKDGIPLSIIFVVIGALFLIVWLGLRPPEFEKKAASNQNQPSSPPAAPASTDLRVRQLMRENPNAEIFDEGR